MNRLGGHVAGLGKRISVVAGSRAGQGDMRKEIESSLKKAGVNPAGDFIPGSRPNSPREDVQRIAAAVKAQAPDAVVAVGGGSLIDATKAAIALSVLGGDHPDLEEYFGIGCVTRMLAEQKKSLIPMVAVQLAASSAAHLTKYSNITDMKTGQKKLMIDEAITPPRALFDYAATTSMDAGFTADGGLDGISHSLEVFYGAKGPILEKVRPVALLGIDLIVNNILQACRQPEDLKAREAVGLGTDLGGYAIMIGGTNGAHLSSFSMVDILPHGRACGLMNPYYTVFFAPAIEPQLRDVGAIFAAAGYMKTESLKLKGRDLGLAVAGALQALARAVGFPTRLNDVPGFGDAHIIRCLAAAKNPQLESKLKNMPVPLSAALVDEYMAPILQAAQTGDFSLIKNMK
ncbi:MAG: 3-dehydroquinate synthase [Verrucomicrobia bacterium]|nr:3-dehydroquinate synthase [Verrucomicrobiota bacterium]